MGKQKRVGRGLGWLALACAIGAPPAWAQSVSGETSRTPVATTAHWRTPDFNTLPGARLRYREMPVQRLFELQKRNAARRMKPVQVGMGRRLNTEGVTTLAQPALSWRSLGQGASAARLDITSPDALAVRAGLQVGALHPDVELRFAGSDHPDRIVAVVSAREAQRQVDGQGLYWAPSTDGQTQLIEIYRPAHVVAAMARVNAPQLAHLLANSRSDFKILEKIGESESCNIDTACRVAELGDRFVRAKNAVAHMLFISKDENGQTGSFICTGTLLNDTATGTQTPYFYSAHHCISDQGVASTLNTFWRYEATSCNSTVSQPVTQLTGGATYLYSSSETDALLLRLADPAPAGAEFSGWDAAALPASSAILGIHHPAGDAKKVSSGQQLPSSDQTHNAVAWLSGSTQGGSSGSGLFTLHADGYRLRGGLHGGDATCANSGSTSNTQNRDWYSRFDVAYPHIRQWLAPTTPILMNGAQPRIPGQANAVSAGNTPTVPRIKARAVFKQRGAFRRYPSP